MSRADGMTLAAAALLAGCSGNSTGLTTAGAMRVEVEVYKGPLAQTVLVQQRELDAILEETALGLDQFAEAAKQADSQHCSEGYKTGCKRLQMAYTDAYQLQMEACTILRTSLQIQDAENRLGSVGA